MHPYLQLHFISEFMQNAKLFSFLANTLPLHCTVFLTVFPFQFDQKKMKVFIRGIFSFHFCIIYQCFSSSLQSKYCLIRLLILGLPEKILKIASIHPVCFLQTGHVDVTVYSLNWSFNLFVNLKKVKEQGVTDLTFSK